MLEDVEEEAGRELRHKVIAAAAALRDPHAGELMRRSRTGPSRQLRQAMNPHPLGAGHPLVSYAS